MYGVIYKIRNRLNGKIYIGQTTCTIRGRVQGHARSKSVLGCAIRKYGIQSLEVIAWDAACSKEWLDRKEEQWIKHFDCLLPRGYNYNPGGGGPVGVKASLNTREKMSLAHKKLYAKNGRLAMHGQ